MHGGHLTFEDKHRDHPLNVTVLHGDTWNHQSTIINLHGNAGCMFAMVIVGIVFDLFGARIMDHHHIHTLNNSSFTGIGLDPGRMCSENVLGERVDVHDSGQPALEFDPVCDRR